jgi:hypothetical protein
MDESSDEILSTTTYRKAGMGQEEGRHSPLEGEWTHLVGECIYAYDLVPNPRASGLFALHNILLLYFVLALQLGTIVICPLFLLREFCRYYLGKTEITCWATIFLYWQFCSFTGEKMKIDF